jgi:uncharacterized protein involved in outer membrane biogenesis
VVKKVLLGVLVVVVIGAVGLFVWARSVLARDTVRNALANRLTQTLGQPVSIGGIGASIFPRVTVHLTNVTIGRPVAITVRSLAIGTDFGALLSRRIEHGAMELSGARIQLPLPELAFASQPATEQPASSSAPVEIVSIDEVALKDVELVSGGRSLHGDIEVAPQGKGVEIKKIVLATDKASVNITGRITDLAGPTGRLAVKARALDVPQLMAFASDFSKGVGMTSTPSTGVTPPSARTASSSASPPMDLTVTMEAERASMGQLQLEKLSGTARLTPAGMTLDPASFGIFGGHYDGTLALTFGSTPDFRVKAALSGVDVASAAAFAGMPNVITGRMSGKADLTGRGMETAAVSRTAKGTVTVDVTNGVIKNLGLIQAVVVATSMRSGASSAGRTSRDEPFNRLGGTLSIANGVATTRDLDFESRDVSLVMEGSVRLDSSAVDLKGKAQLSEALSQQAGRDLQRYTQDQGRVTLPATVSGPAASPQVRIDLADLAQRAIRNRAGEEAQKAVVKGLGDLLKRK